VLILVLKNLVATFKETSDLLQITCDEISRFQLIISQDLRTRPILHSGYINRDKRPNYSSKAQLKKKSFRVLVFVICEPFGCHFDTKAGLSLSCNF
jgi:hypothetical protein